MIKERGEVYDPTAPEGEVASRGQYMTNRQLRTLILSFGGLLLLLVPVYHLMLGRTESARCTQNMKAIAQALTLYATEHDGRYPPLARTETIDGEAPSLGDTGHVYTWISDVQSYMSARASFLCPAAKPEEEVIGEDPRTKALTIRSSYGMYAPYGSYLTSVVENPDQTVIVAETSNLGANGTYDPDPLKLRNGQAVPDGFAMNWDDSNDSATKKSNAVTRLAFTSDGHFKKDGDARHGTTIHALTASGEEINLNPESAYFRVPGTTQVNPTWTVPPTEPQR